VLVVVVRNLLVADTISPSPTESPLALPDSTPIESASPNISVTPTPAKLLLAALAREPTGEPTSSFSTETPRIYLRWQSEALHAGEKLRCIWIAEDVGEAAPSNYHVDEVSFTADGPHASGTFTLSKPKKGWPPGKYRAEIYLRDKLVETVPFTIEPLRGD